MKNKLIVVVAIWIFLFGTGLGIINTAFATSLNLDFGSENPTIPSNSFGAASGQTGSWNVITGFSTLSGILDTDGNSTGITVSITAASMSGSNGSIPTTDATYLMANNFYSLGIWDLTLAGIDNGIYDVYLYEPRHLVVGSGSGNSNGIAFSEINGNFASETFIEGSNYHLLSGVTVSGNVLEVTGSGQSFPFSGLAGLQLVESASNPVPEPATMLLFGIGLLGLAGVNRKKIK